MEFKILNMAKGFEDLFGNRPKSTAEELLLCVRTISSYTIGDVIGLLDKYLSENPDILLNNELEEIRQNYDYLLNFMKLGTHDEKRHNIVIDLKRQLQSLTADAFVWNDRLHSPLFREAWSSVTGSITSFSPADIYAKMQQYVSDMAMVDFNEDAEDARRETIRSHFAYVKLAFNSLLTSTHWNESQARTMTELLTSPTCDADDQYLMLNALMLNAIEYFDFNKLSVFAQTYKSDICNRRVRQAALVALVLSTDSKMDLHQKEQKALLESLFKEKPESVEDMIALQKEFLKCMEAEKDAKTLSEDFIPEIIKNSPDIKITPSGIEERKHDPLRDILDPHAEEREQEAVEDVAKRMKEMMREGSDLYYGAFSQLKRHSFFTQNPINWFCPFTLNHPDLAHIPNDVKEMKMVKLLLAKGPFCDSDKYSLMLTISQILKSIPPTMHQIMNEGGINDDMLLTDEKESGHTIRQRHLRALYRFYMLSPNKDNVTNILAVDGKIRKIIGGQRIFFIADPLYRGTAVTSCYMDLTRELIKKGKGYRIAVQMLLNNFDASPLNIDYHKLNAYFLLKQENEVARIGAEISLMFILTQEPEDVWAMKNLAKIYTQKKEYDKACELYKKLRNKEPENQKFVLGHATSLMFAGKTKEASQLLFYLYYENPDSIKITRSLAWCQLLNNAAGESLKTFAHLFGVDSLKTDTIVTTPDNILDDDYLGAGFAAWLDNDLQLAVKMLKKYVSKQSKEKLLEEIKTNNALKDKGIDSIDAQLMLDLIR